MGWVSLLEDAIERFTSEENSIKLSYCSNSGTLRLEQYDSDGRMQSLISACDGLLRDLKEHLDLATSPNIDLTHELLEEKRKRKHLEEKVDVLQRQLLSHIALSRREKSLETEAVPANKLKKNSPSTIKQRQSKSQQLRVCEFCQSQVNVNKYENHKKKAHRITTEKKKPLTPINAINERPTKVQRFNGIRMWR